MGRCTSNRLFFSTHLNKHLWLFHWLLEWSCCEELRNIENAHVHTEYSWTEIAIRSVSEFGREVREWKKSKKLLIAFLMWIQHTSRARKRGVGWIFGRRRKLNPPTIGYRYIYTLEQGYFLLSGFDDRSRLARKGVQSRYNRRMRLYIEIAVSNKR